MKLDTEPRTAGRFWLGLGRKFIRFPKQLKDFEFKNSGGDVTNAGSHSLDNVQWALGTDDTGPVEVEPHGNQHDSEVTFRYASGVLLKLSNAVTSEDVSAFGAIFVGQLGRLVMHRGRFNTEPIAI